MIHAASREEIDPGELHTGYNASLLLAIAPLRQSISFRALLQSESVLCWEQVFGRLAVISYGNLLLHPIGILQTASILSLFSTDHGEYISQVYLGRIG
ncbi:hypothetical protein AXX02_24540 [Pseudomonas aeruginosa]|nr:hypothetical protein AXX02_24540 [Pseudomonas aeruginosa]